MANMITDIVGDELVAKLDNKLKVLSSTPSANNTQTLVFCDIKWLELYNYFIGFIQVVSINGNEVKVSTTNAINVGDILEIPLPKYFHGTPMNTVQEWHDFSTNEKEKLPFIWLVTPVDENYQDRKSTIERVSNCEIFFVHWSNWLELNQNRVNDTVRPLHYLVNEFLDIANNSPKVMDRLANNGQRKEYPKFGRETNKGIEEVIMNSTLGAIKLDVEFRIKKSYVCKC